MIVSPNTEWLSLNIAAHTIFCSAQIKNVVTMWQVGGLADVIPALSRALQKNGHRVEIILPKYDCMDDSCIKNFKVCPLPC